MTLQRLYLCVHALSWIEISPAEQRQRELRWGGGEHWPGRTAACHELDLVLRQKMQRLIREIAGNDDQAFLILPTGLRGNRELIEFARAHLGPRCLVCRLGADLAENRRILGTGFSRGLAADRAAATAPRRTAPRLPRTSWRPGNVPRLGRRISTGSSPPAATATIRQRSSA